MKIKQLASTFALFLTAGLMVASLSSCRTGHLHDSAQLKNDQEQCDHAVTASVEEVKSEQEVRL